MGRFVNNFGNFKLKFENIIQVQTQTNLFNNFDMYVKYLSNIIKIFSSLYLRQISPLHLFSYLSIIIKLLDI